MFVSKTKLTWDTHILYRSPFNQQLKVTTQLRIPDLTPEPRKHHNRSWPPHNSLIYKIQSKHRVIHCIQQLFHSKFWHYNILWFYNVLFYLASYIENINLISSCFVSFLLDGFINSKDEVYEDVSCKPSMVSCWTPYTQINDVYDVLLSFRKVSIILHLLVFSKWKKIVSQCLCFFYFQMLIFGMITCLFG